MPRIQGSNFSTPLTDEEHRALAAGVANARLRSQLERLDPLRLRERDLPSIDGLEADGLRVRSVAAHAAGLQSYCERLREAARWGVSSRPRVLAAAMLAAHAVRRQRDPARPLRADLAPNLHVLVASKTADRGRSPATLAVDGKTVSLGRTTEAYLEAYGKLLLRAGGRVERAMERCVTDPAVRLRLGRELSTLDPVAIERRLSAVLGSQGSMASTIPHEGNGQDTERTPLLRAPTGVDVRFDWFRCDVEQDTTGDEVFWVCTFVSLKDVAKTVEDIERAIAADANGTAQSAFSFEWTTTTWQSPKRSAPRGAEVNVAESIGGTAIRRGFGPWCAVVTGIEDDDDEYVAVQEVVHQVGDYAETVSDVAWKVSQIATVVGATHVAAAADAVALGAEVVAVGADVVEAVIEIVNYFDSNDLLGRVSLGAPDDYVGIARGTVDARAPVTAANPDNGARYTVQVSYVYRDSDEEFRRAWRTQSWTTKEKREHEWTVGGLSGEDNIGFVFPEPVNWLMWVGPSYTVDGNNRHAELVSGPTLVPTPVRLPSLNITLAANQSATAKVHYGTKAFHGIDYSVEVTGTKLLYPR